MAVPSSTGTYSWMLRSCIVQHLLLVFRTSKFVLVKEQLVEFNQLAIEHANGHEDMLNR